MKYKSLRIVNYTLDINVKRAMESIALEGDNVLLRNVDISNYLYHFASKGLIWTIAGSGLDVVLRLWHKEHSSIENKEKAWQFKLKL